MRFRVVPESTPLDDLEGPLCTLFQNTCAIMLLLIDNFHIIQSALTQCTAVNDCSGCSASRYLDRCYNGLGFSEREATNN